MVQWSFFSSRYIFLFQINGSSLFHWWSNWVLLILYPLQTFSLHQKPNPNDLPHTFRQAADKPPTNNSYYNRHYYLRPLSYKVALCRQQPVILSCLASSPMLGCSCTTTWSTVSSLYHRPAFGFPLQTAFAALLLSTINLSNWSICKAFVFLAINSSNLNVYLRSSDLS